MNARSLGWLAVALTLSIATPRGASVGFATEVDSKKIAAIEKIVAEGLEAKDAASYAVGIVRDGNLVLARGYGYADLENDVPATAETVYRLGSITKQFTAMAIMQLAERGKLSVDDELTKFLPDYPVEDHKFTVHQLLTHTSGIKSYTNRPDFRRLARGDFSHDEMRALFQDEPLDFEPGTKWMYSNSGYYLLGMIIEKASGQKYGTYLQKNIFGPLGMTATRYGELRPIIRHRARGYAHASGDLVNDDPIGMTAPGAAGALVSNVLDLIKWHQALEAGRLLSPESYEAMYRETKLADGSTHPYGYGWEIGALAEHRKLSHGGGINGFSTMLARYPDDRQAVIVLANTAGANVGSLERKIAKVLLDIREEPVVDLPVEAEMLEDLTGTYELPGFTLVFTIDDGKLVAKSDGRPKDRLKYQGGRRFVSSRDDEFRIRFTPAEGRASGFDLDVAGRKFAAQRAE